MVHIFQSSLNEQRVDSRGNHLGRELRLLFGEGGAEGVALGDPVGLHRPKHRNKNDSTVNNYQDTVGGILCVKASGFNIKSS